jgi:hypothetical protein
MPFIADASSTLLRRLLRGERIWQAHRDHTYQRLVRLGFGHTGTLALYGGLMSGTAASALAAVNRAPQLGWYLLVAWAALLGVLFGAVAHQWRFRISPDR